MINVVLLFIVPSCQQYCVVSVCAVAAAPCCVVYFFRPILTARMIGPAALACVVFPPPSHLLIGIPNSCWLFGLTVCYCLIPALAPLPE